MRLRALITGRHDAGILWSLSQRMTFVDSGEDALLLVGDRYETALAAVEATRSRVPIIHLHGGEVTEGASDDAFRNAITKLAHLHLVSTVGHGARVVAMGEDVESVHVIGAPGLDNAWRLDLCTKRQLEIALEIPLVAPVVIVTLHPATLGEDPRVEFEAVQYAMNEVRGTYIITQPNTDPGHEHMRSWKVRHPHKIVKDLGPKAYWGLMRIADAMLGNSSSGLIEAPTLQLPVVNVGDRQKGRLRGANVIDVDPDPDEVTAGLEWAISDTCRMSLGGTFSPYGDGKSAERIVKVLEKWTVPNPARKRPVAA